MSFLAAAVQLNSRENKQDNLAAAIAGAEAAAAGGAQLIVLPEYSDYLGPVPSALALADPIPGPTSELFAALAARLGVMLVAGSHWERPDQESTTLHNTVTAFDRHGVLVARYRKVHAFDAVLAGLGPAQESSAITRGDEVGLADIDGLRVGLATCYDLRFPEIFRAQFEAGAQVVTIPSAFRTHTGRDHWEVLIRARAIENQCHVIAADQVGQDGRGLSSYGRSMIVDPWGTVLACAPDEPGVVFATIDLDRQARLREAMPIGAQRRPEVYRRPISVNGRNDG